VPERALLETAARHVQLRNFSSEMVLERRVRDAVQGGQSLSGFVSSVASSAPVPGGGSVAAHVGALAAALVQMVAGLTVGKKKYASVDVEMRALALDASALVTQLSALVSRDAAAFAEVSAAYKMPNEPADAAAKRSDAVTKALIGAAQVPLETARACVRAAELAVVVANKGNTNAASDAGVAALLAEAGCRGAALNVRINVASLDDKSRGASLLEEANQLVQHVGERVKAAMEAAERTIGA
jgi:glutamate formiminotransferase/formiminotetrahydrofolate cyclodeaminase